MTTPWRRGLFILAGLAWIFLARLADDVAASFHMTTTLLATPLVVNALLLPYRAGLITLLVTAFLLDAGTGTPFGLSASLLAPLHLILHRLRHQFPRDSTAIAAILAACITPALWIAHALFVHWREYPLPGDLDGALTEVVVSTLLAAPGTAWLFSMYQAIIARTRTAVDDESAYEES